MEANEVRTFQVAITEFDGPPLVEPPIGEGIIEVSTAKKTYKSKPFKFSELPFEGPH
jgi:hypothetical protein